MMIWVWNLQIRSNKLNQLIYLWVVSHIDLWGIIHNLYKIKMKWENYYPLLK